MEYAAQRNRAYLMEYATRWNRAYLMEYTAQRNRAYLMGFTVQAKVMILHRPDWVKKSVLLTCQMQHNGLKRSHYSDAPWASWLL